MKTIMYNEQEVAKLITKVLHDAVQQDYANMNLREKAEFTFIWMQENLREVS